MSIIIDGTPITDVTIDGTNVQEITIDGVSVWKRAIVAKASVEGYWPVSEGSGLTLYDESGNNYDGDILGSSWTSGGGDYVLSFDGTDDRVTLPNGIFDNLSVGSISLWFKTSSTNDLVFLGYNDKANEYQARMFFRLNKQTGGNPDFYGKDASGTEFGIQPSNSLGLNDGVWHHLVVSIGSNNNMYIDGSQVSLTYFFGNSSMHYFFGDCPGSGTSAYAIGDSWYNGYPHNPFDGLLDDVRVYNKALSATEVSNIYEGTRGLYGV